MFIHPKLSGVFSALLYNTNFNTVKNKLGNELCYVLIRQMLLLSKKENYNPFSKREDEHPQCFHSHGALEPVFQNLYSLFLLSCMYMVQIPQIGNHISHI